MNSKILLRLRKHIATIQKHNTDDAAFVITCWIQKTLYPDIPFIPEQFQRLCRIEQRIVYNWR